MIYNTDYFINKFENIPEGRWIVGQAYRQETQQFCALGFCSCIFTGNHSETAEAEALWKVFDAHRHIVTHVNDGTDLAYQQPTVKQRILAALYDFKAKEALVEAQEIINQPAELCEA